MVPLKGQYFLFALIFFGFGVGLVLAQPVAQGFSENDSDPRKVLLEQIFPDLRVFVDIDSLDPPRNLGDGKLSYAEVCEAIQLGIGNWAAVLPELKFRLVPKSDSANLVIRFRAYGKHISGGASAEAFLPGQWRPAKPERGGYDFSCGAKEFGKLPSGTPCHETSNNIILFQNSSLAFRRIHYLDVAMHAIYLSSMAQRTEATRPFFRFLPDPHYRSWPPDRTSCKPGAAQAGQMPSWDPICFLDTDWAALPNFDKFGQNIGPYDIASLVQHEFGHTLLGGHTGGSGRCTEVENQDYQDFARDPVYKKASAVRKASRPASPKDSSSYSILFSGNGLDAAWNSRGVFPFDGLRLAQPALDWDCKPIKSWPGYRTSYPRVAGWIVLSKPTGETKYVDDWNYAVRLMEWPQSHGDPISAGWFQTGMLLK